MKGVLVDIDDTIIDTKSRTKAIMESILNQEITWKDFESLTHEKIFLKYATEKQKSQAKELRVNFLNLLLCKNKAGIESFKYNKPIPHAAELLQMWKENFKIIYLTGRLKIVYDQTIEELNRFGFPTEDAELIMFDPVDWGEGSLLDARKRLMSSIIKRIKVVRVIDDFPGYFLVYKQFLIPDRIGFKQSKLYEISDYLEKGATRVIENWSQLIGDPP